MALRGRAFTRWIDRVHPQTGRRPILRESEAPSVAWPSEAVRVQDESIAFIHKRVAAPFYGR